ncbi:tyrosine-type recombinase/integrase [Akkermansia sp.]
MAGIIKRGNKWIAVVRSLDGKELRKTTGIDVVPKALMPGANKRAGMAQNEARARLVAEEMEKEVRYGVFDLEKVKAIAGESAAALKAGRNGVSVGKFLLGWLESRRNRRGAVERDGVAVRRFLDFLGDGRNMVLTAVNKGMAKSFVERELERVSAGTVIRYVSTLSGAFNVAVDREFIPRNPFRGAMPSKADHQAEKQLRGAFTIDEVKTILDRFPGEWPDMVRVCLYTGGQRLGDIATLKWSQIDLEHCFLFMTTEKTRRRMNKPIIEPLRDVLERRLACRVNEFVFPLAAMKHAQAGGRSDKLSTDFTSLLRRHGIVEDTPEDVKGDRHKLASKSFHSLRATAVTVLRLAGVPADLCRYIVGHDSEEIERVYFRPDAADVQDAMSRIADGLK